jgi:hypothetical protein
MNTQHYQLRLEGLDEAKGQIKAYDLHKVLGALLKTAERCTRLLATGEGSVQGTRPAWLEASIDFTVTGLRKGSTILDIDAPLLLDTAHDQFSQSEFWRESPEAGDTALDLAALAIEEAQSDGDTSDRYDSSVLEAVLEFKKAVRSARVRYEFKSTSNARGKFQLSESSFERIAERKRQLPEPKAFIVSGNLDEIKHSAGRFRLFLLNGQKLLGRVHPEFLDGESLRHLWGKAVTVEGMVHFKANGQARLIDARKLSLKTDGDEIFEALPAVSNPHAQSDLFPDAALASKFHDPMILWGAWPGDEPLEELMAQLS